MYQPVKNSSLFVFVHACILPNMFDDGEGYTSLKVRTRFPGSFSRVPLTGCDVQALSKAHCIYLLCQEASSLAFGLDRYVCSGKGCGILSGFDEVAWLSYLAALGTWVLWFWP